MKSFFSAVILSTALIVYNIPGYAARMIDLDHQPVLRLQKFMQGNHQSRGAAFGIEVKTKSKSVDFNQTEHVRVYETFNGYPVWGSDAVIHYPNGTGRSLRTATMNGDFFEDLQPDLANAPAYIFKVQQAKKAISTAVQLYKAETAINFTTDQENAKLIVYVDEQQKAHWVFEVSFKTSRIRGIPAKPVYLLDAISFTVYEHWNDIKTVAPGMLVPGGGIGGNGRIGKITYDGAQGHRTALNIERGESNKTCYLRNDTVIIRDRRYHDEVPSFRCEKPDNQHNGVYWNTLDDAANGGYSPNNDGLYSDMIVRDMYMKWFDVPMLMKDGKPMQVTFYVHDQLEEQNAYYENGEMVFGEGDSESYPVVAPSVVAHEMSHGFTEQYSGLRYHGQSGALNEAFSDMADKSVEYFEYGKNNWTIDDELLKDGGRALRFMDDPPKDCEGKKQGEECSIGHFKDYKKSLNIHHSSGVFNKAFYLIATAWDTRKAFEVMVQANMHYWTTTTNFAKAACGVVKAARDYKYDEKTIKDAMRAVGVTTSKC